MNKGNPKKAAGPKPEGSSKPKVQSRKQKIAQPEPKDAGRVPVSSEAKSEIDNSNFKIKSSPAVDRHAPTQPTMEVHHHPQLEHKPKPWKEYLLEGFMIFIAVMMGFIAENIREDINNHEHVKQLTAQLVRDLKVDTALLNFEYKAEADVMKNNDTLFRMLQQPIASIDLKKLQLLITNAKSVFLFHPSMGAINAIKNEIHLKQFSNSKMVGFIADYEKHIELTHAVQDILMQYQHSYLDPFLRLHFTPANLDAAFSEKPELTTQMRNVTQADLTQLATDLVLFKINQREQLRDDNFIKDDAVNMLKYIREQYNPEE